MRRWADPRLIVSLLVTTGAFAISLIVLLVRADTSSETVGVVLGVWLTGGLGVVVQFWLGSSKGSADKGAADRARLQKMEDDEDELRR